MVERDDSSENPDYSETTPWLFAHALEEGDKIRVNNRVHGLTVTSIDRDTNKGATTKITLTGNGTTYTIRVSNHAPSDPLLTYPSASQSEPVVDISPVDDTIISTTHANEYLTEPLLPEHEHNSTPELDANSLEHVGDCPKCGYGVVEQHERVVCTECGAWAYQSEWVYYVKNHS